MFKLKFVILLLLVSSIAHSNYSTPGSGRNWNLDSLVFYSGGNVTYSNSVYYFNDTITISDADTLKILHNSTVKSASFAVLIINGVFNINPPDSVKFTAIDTNMKYIGFVFEQTSGASIMKKLIFEYANSIRINSANIIIDSSIIRYNTYTSTASSGAIRISLANPVISNCKIYRNRGSAILSPSNGNASPVIIGNFIYENNVNNENYPQINLGRTNSSVPIIIRNNIIRGYFDKAGGIAISTLAGGNVENCIIENNLISKNRYGIAFLGSNIYGTVSGNIIDSNNIENLPMLGGSGLNFNGTSTQSIKVRKNIIRGNLWGVTIQGTAKPILGDLNIPDTLYIGLNHIYNNSHNDTIFDLYNNTPDSIKAENNYWGTMNSDTIEAHIFHKPDNTSLGFVDYIPFTNLSPVNNEISFHGNSFILYDGYPNPFNSRIKFAFRISGNQFIKFSLIDIAGRELHILHQGMLGEGEYNFFWDAGKFPCGIYFYRLNSGNISLTKKAVLIK